MFDFLLFAARRVHRSGQMTGYEICPPPGSGPPLSHYTTCVVPRAVWTHSWLLCSCGLAPTGRPLIVALPCLMCFSMSSRATKALSQPLSARGYVGAGACTCWSTWALDPAHGLFAKQLGVLAGSTHARNSRFSSHFCVYFACL